MKKILIFGYSHCGTTILKSIIGHIDIVYNIINESMEITNNDIDTVSKFNKYKYIICKYPKYKKIFFSNKYKDYIKIFIIRNPVWVFSSINRRTDYNSSYHSIKEYEQVVKIFNLYIKKKNNNLYLIKYEELFDNNYQKLKDILNDIKLEYTDDIFNNSNYKNYCSPCENIEEVDETKHIQFRTWQINQSFDNKNLLSKIDLTIEQKKELLNSKEILLLYPNIKEYITL